MILATWFGRKIINTITKIKSTLLTGQAVIDVPTSMMKRLFRRASFEFHGSSEYTQLPSDRRLIATLDN